MNIERGVGKKEGGGRDGETHMEGGGGGRVGGAALHVFRLIGGQRSASPPARTDS